MLPPSDRRAVPLVLIQVRADSAQRAGGLDISKSSVRLVDFDLSLTGTGDEPDALTIRDGGELAVERLLTNVGGDRLAFATAGVALGDGRVQRLGGGRNLTECALLIGEGVVWSNTGGLGIGVRMNSAVTVETRLADGTPSTSPGDVFLGVQPGSGGDLTVLGDFATGPILAGSRPGTSAFVKVERGGLLQSGEVRGATGKASVLIARVDDAPVSEAGDPRDYTSAGEQTAWEIAGPLSLSGVIGGAAGRNGGGIALVEARDGGLITTTAADVGGGRSSIIEIKGRSAGIIATGWDPVDRQQSEIRISGPLTVGQGCAGTVRADEGALVGAQRVEVKALGRLVSEGVVDAAEGQVDLPRSEFTTRRETADGTALGDAIVDGGGRVELGRGGIITAGTLKLGGVTPKKRLARLRIDSSDTASPRCRLDLQGFVIGAGPAFPARMDLIDGVVQIEEDSVIAEGGRLLGFGLISSTPEIEVRNEGEIIIPPGEGRQLVINGNFAQSGRTVITVNKGNAASTAPLQVEGESLLLGGQVTLRFTGGRKPERGEAFALIRAENALITNAAQFKVSGAQGAFDIVQDDFGLTLVFR